MSQKILRSLFGDPAETLEDRGDELRLNGFPREAVYFYGQALQGLPRTAMAARREKLERKLAECREATFRRLLEEAESLEARGRRREALTLLTDAELFAQATEEVDIARARRQRLEARLHGRLPARAGAAGAGAQVPGAVRGQDPFAPGASLPRTLPPGGADIVPGLKPAEGGWGAHAPAPPASPWQDLAVADTPEVRVARLQAEVQAHPESSLAHEALGEAYRSVGRLEDARAAYEAAYQRNPERLRLVIEAARLMRGEPEGEAPAAGGPGRGAIPEAEARLRLERGIQRLEQACRRHRPTPASLPLHTERLLWLAEAGRVDEALAGFGDLLSVTGLDRGFLHFNRAGVQEQAGLLEGARADLEAAVQAAPDHVLYRERLSDVCVRLRDRLPEALARLQEALDLDAHDFSRKDLVGLAPVDARGRTGSSAARAAFSPDRARLLFKMARILYLLERDDEARARVADALVICRDPRVEEALLELRRSLGA